MNNSLNDDGSNCLLAGLHCAGHIHLIIGSDPLAATRCTQSLAAGARPILIAPEDADLHYGLRGKIEDGSVRWKRGEFEDEMLFRLGRGEVGGVVDAAFVTMSPKDESTIHISSLCKRNRIPINVVDAPHLCTFSLLSTHTDGPLQIGVTTNGRGCKLASRIRREIASSLPPHLGAACARFGLVRRRLQHEDVSSLQVSHQQQKAQNGQNGGGFGDLDDSVDQNSSFNKLVTAEEEAAEDVRIRRMRWLSQVCEYWPLKKLASVGDEDMDRLLESCISSTANANSTTAPSAEKKQDDGDDTKKGKGYGSIILAGSGPGHPHLLTQATYHAIQSADLILADKLVPSGVMDLIPRRTQVHIARKFPGNADQAQDELQRMALEAAARGKTVLRLKQGDPFIYGRGGEEVAYFRDRGYGGEGEKGKVVVLPGVTSALSAPLFAGIPATQRDVADQVLICTGTGRKGSTPTPPEYVPSRTVIFLMALHRITSLIHELTTEEPNSNSNSTSNSNPEEEEEEEEESKNRTLWPLTTPCAVIERASCPDQRVIRSTLQHVAQAIEAEGSRPPGLLVVGNACEFLLGEGEREEARRAWVVEEGFRGLEDEHIVSAAAAAAAAAGLGMGLGN